MPSIPGSPGAENEGSHKWDVHPPMQASETAIPAQPWSRQWYASPESAVSTCRRLTAPVGDARLTSV